MKKFINILSEYVNFSNDHKLTEKSFYCTLSIYVSVIFLCLFCLAYSSASLFYKQVGYCDDELVRALVNVEIYDKTESTALTESKLGGYVIRPGSEYSVKLSSDSDIDTMFCKISIIANNGNKVYYTSQLCKDDVLQFDVITSSVATIEITSVSGCYIDYSSSDNITNGASVTF